MKIDNTQIYEIKNFWGEDGLYKWLPERLSGTELSGETKIFLSTIGMPRAKPYEEVVWFFEEFMDLIPLKTHYEKLQITQVFPPNIENSYVFATECEGVCCFCICLDDESVIYLNPEIEESLRYCNSSIELFCCFLTEFYKTGLSVRDNNLDEESEFMAIKSLTDKLQLTDSKAFESQVSFWNTVLLDFQ